MAFIAICLKGHVHSSRTEEWFTDGHCIDRGSRFIVECPACKKRLVGNPTLKVVNGQTVMPERLEHCLHCGAPMPYNTPWQRIARLPLLGWREFKSLPPLQAAVVLVAVLFLAGALTWSEIKDLLKGLGK